MHTIPLRRDAAPMPAQPHRRPALTALLPAVAALAAIAIAALPPSARIGFGATALLVVALVWRIRRAAQPHGPVVVPGLGRPLGDGGAFPGLAPPRPWRNRGRPVVADGGSFPRAAVRGIGLGRRAPRRP